ncbi:TlpA family protein disulfide reductase [Leeuwenhoekiella marinoflava]|uniref:Thioredoxin-like protein n=2 Tax=Leeuwenhoekiella marinoflava TaxID=988 RepID=A0A4V1KS50_9FLAO|nr:TlpA disulfide reductase family protein [Leeuwenhoekiella marinoflava]RXG27590.1 thioredoxin-like protein [Leeuwenhoekiella marinoflava]SHF66488.1 Thioredoxin-like [Leeuwenhoekiella marinoflava DSM 3653]
MKIILAFLTILCFSAGFSQEKSFSTEALKDLVINTSGSEVTFESVLEKHKGKTVLIDIWASWCKDCIEGFPDLKKLQKENPNVFYVFLSLDKDTERWKEGIEKYKLQGSHYFIKSGWKGPLCSSIDLDWIPRYILLDESGKIKVYKAITTKDNQLLNQI